MALGKLYQTDIGITGGGQDSSMLYLNGIQKTSLQMMKLYLK